MSPDGKILAVGLRDGTLLFYDGGKGCLENTALIGIGAEKGTSQNLEVSLLAELKKIQESGVTAKELEKAKNQVVSEAIRERETNDGKAIAIEQAVAYQGDPKAVNRDVAALQAVTAADIQRVMKQYFKDNNRVVIHYNQEKKAEGTK